MVTLTFELDFQAEATVVTAADKLAAIRRLCDSQMVEGTDGTLIDADGIWPSEVMKLINGEPDVMRTWAAPSTDGTTDQIEITESQ